MSSRTRLRLVPVLAAILITGCGTTPPGTPAAGTAGRPEIVEAYIPRGRAGRWRIRHLDPRYITVHSTENYSRYGTAQAHARMLQEGALKARHNSLGYLTWHYTVDSTSIYQSLPDDEQGQHADYEGPGNRYSIGIEMCENAGGSRQATVDRTARLVAYLMHRHGIPLSRVVPHQHWRRVRYSDHRDLGQKDCPHFLLDHGRPGREWQKFLGLVQRYYRGS